jgi:hypothetical protein
MSQGAEFRQGSIPAANQNHHQQGGLQIFKYSSLHQMPEDALERIAIGPGGCG